MPKGVRAGRCSSGGGGDTVARDSDRFRCYRAPTDIEGIVVHIRAFDVSGAPRSTDIVDLFAGHGGVGTAGRERGLVAEGFDIRNGGHPNQRSALAPGRPA